MTLCLAAASVAPRAARACDNQTNGWVNGVTNYWHGTLGKEEFCNNASVGPDRTAAANCAWNYTVSHYGAPTDPGCARQALDTYGAADLDAFVKKWQVAVGADCSQSTINYFFNYWHGALGKAEVCNNASIGPDREKAKNCAFQALVRDKGVSPTSCLRDAIANTPQGSADLDAFVKTWQVASGADCSQSTIDHFYNYWYGALGKAEVCNNASIGPDREKAKACAFQALRDIGVSATSCLRDAIPATPQGTAALDAFVKTWQVASGADCSQSTIDHFYNYWHGALGKAEVCNNASIGPDREKAKDCAFQALVSIGVSPTSCLRDAIANTPQGSADLDTFVKKWQTATGADCSQATIDYYFNYWHGALGKAEVCNNASVGPDREEAKNCAFQALVAIGVSPTSCLRDAIANSPQGSADLDEFVRKWIAQESRAPAGTIAANMQSLTPATDEACDPSTSFDENFFPPTAALDWTATTPVSGKLTALKVTIPSGFVFDAPKNFTNAFGANEGRLRAELRAAAKAADPVASLCQSAKAFGRDDTVLGRAFADLSVTGKRSFARFREHPPTDKALAGCTKSAAAIASALNRAYNVANAIRFGRSPDRHRLGWIAVSGEDDQPHRPVNVPTAEFPQHDLSVTVPVRSYNGLPPAPPITISTRYMIANPPPGGLARPPHRVGRSIPADPKPALDPDADVILFIHGMDSRLEEALDLTHALHQLAARGGKKKYTVISMDLPTSGYADNIDHLQIAPLATTGHAIFRPIGAADIELNGVEIFDAGVRNNVPIVDFIEDFIVAFVDKLNGIVPVKAQLRVIVGGSLGGNMAMRLGRRPDLPWIKAVAPWSPAAIWPSYAGGNKLTDHLAAAIPWLLAGGDVRSVPETDVMRRLFFYYGFDWRMGLAGFLTAGKPQAEEWFRDGWACKAARMFGARIDRHETYDAKFRLWHWRLAAEQLVFSQQLISLETRQPLYMQNATPMLLMCGYDDTGADLCKHTRSVAAKMTATPGRAFFLHTTGHSMDTERPAWVAKAIVDFISK